MRVLAEAGRNATVAERFQQGEVEARRVLSGAIQAARGIRKNAPAEDVAIALLALYDGLLARFIFANQEEAARLVAASRSAIKALLPVGGP